MSGRAPKEIFEELCEAQGRKKAWCAERAGLTPQQLTNKFAGRRGYVWQDGEREAIAEALGVPVRIIWPEADASAARQAADAPE